MPVQYNIINQLKPIKGNAFSVTPKANKPLRVVTDTIADKIKSLLGEEPQNLRFVLKPDSTCEVLLDAKQMAVLRGALSKERIEKVRRAQQTALAAGKKTKQELECAIDHCLKSEILLYDRSGKIIFSPRKAVDLLSLAEETGDLTAQIKDYIQKNNYYDQGRPVLIEYANYVEKPVEFLQAIAGMMCTTRQGAKDSYIVTGLLTQEMAKTLRSALESLGIAKKMLSITQSRIDPNYSRVWVNRDQLNQLIYFRSLEQASVLESRYESATGNYRVANISRNMAVERYGRAVSASSNHRAYDDVIYLGLGAWRDQAEILDDHGVKLVGQPRQSQSTCRSYCVHVLKQANDYKKLMGAEKAAKKELGKGELTLLVNAHGSADSKVISAADKSFTLTVQQVGDFILNNRKCYSKYKIKLMQCFGDLAFADALQAYLDENKKAFAKNLIDLLNEQGMSAQGQVIQFQIIGRDNKAWVGRGNKNERVGDRGLGERHNRKVLFKLYPNKGPQAQVLPAGAGAAPRADDEKMPEANGNPVPQFAARAQSARR